MKRLSWLIVGLLIFGLGAYSFFLWKKRLICTHPVKLRIVNVLDDTLFKDAHIQGAPGVESINVPFEKVKEVAQNWQRDIPVVFYCSNYMCTASGDAVKVLKEMGFTTVNAYEGGMAEWYQLGRSDPLFKTEGEARLDYLTYVVKARAEIKDYAVSAQELQKMIKQASILSTAGDKACNCSHC